MSNNLSVVIGADTSKFQRAIDDARKKLNQYSSDAKSSAQTIEGAVSVTAEQATAYERVVKALEKVSSGSLNTAQSQKNLTQQIQELKIQWQALSEAQKNSDFGQSLSATLASAQTKLTELRENAKAAGESISNMGGNQEIPLKRQLKMLTTELVALTNTYRNMSAEEKASAEGVELAKKMDEIREKAGTLKDTIGDVSAEISVMASDTPNLDVFNQLLGIGADAMTTYAGIVGKLTGDEKALKDMIATVTMVQGAANLSTKVTNALQSSSNIMLKTRAIQEKAAAAAITIRNAAEGKGVIATKAATVAQKAFNLVAKANPYVLLATAVLGAASALYAFAQKSAAATEKEKELQREAELAKQKFEEQKHASETLGGKTGDLVGTFKVLQSQWKSLKTEAEKKEWIEANQSAFNALNLSVWNVNDAYDVFVKNAPKVVAALKAIAEAEAYQDLYKDAIKKREVEWGNRHRSQETGDYYRKAKAGQGVMPYEIRDAGLGESDFYRDGELKVLTEAGANKLNKYRNDQAVKLNKSLQKGYDETVSHYAQLMDEANAKAEAAKAVLSTYGGTGTRPNSSGSGKGGSTTTPQKTPKQTYDEEIAEIERKLADGYISDIEANKEKVQASKKYIEALYDNGTITTEQSKQLQESISAWEDAIIALERVKDANDDIRKATDDYNSAMLLTASKQASGLINSKKARDEEISALEKYIDSVLKAANTIGGVDKLSEEQQKSIQEYIDKLNALKKVGKLQELKDRQSELEEELLGLNVDSQLFSFVREGILQELKQVKKDIEDTEIKLRIKLPEDKIKEQFQGKNLPIEDLSKYIELLKEQGLTYDQIIEKLNEISKLSETAQNLNTLGSAIGSLGNNISSLGGKTAQVIGTITTAVGQTVGLIGQIMAFAAAQAVQNAFALPFPANIPAFATVIGMIASAVGIVGGMVGKFANGGIVGGATTIGDYNFARVNKGEMILNGTQQAHLFNLINANNSASNNGRFGGGQVEFKIKGKELIGVINNYNKQRGNI